MKKVGIKHTILEPDEIGSLNDLFELGTELNKQQTIYKDIWIDSDSAKSDRETLYKLDTYTSQPASRVDPNNHTMQPGSFFSYIGRSNRMIEDLRDEPYYIDCKKFNEQQKSLIKTAFTDQCNVRVLGVYREDLSLVSDRLGFEVDPEEQVEHLREKDFNNIRPSMVWARPKDSTKARELWVVVFPSKQYVSQTAALIQAIFDDFVWLGTQIPSLRAHDTPPSVFEDHFPELESNIPNWTGFDDSIGRYIRHGDVVIFGNIDLILPTMIKAGFEPTTEHWSRFGLRGKFGAKVLIHKESLKRVVLLGVNEVYWGDSCAQYIKSTVRAGATHILYASKAATMVDEGVINQVHAPSTFITLKEDGGVTPQISMTRGNRAATEQLLDLFKISVSGLAITVPTVIGEDQIQRQVFSARNPAVMDCENGHIATVISEYNDVMTDNFGSTVENFISFLPVHFMTDYVHRHSEVNPKDPPQDKHITDQQKPTNDLANTDVELRRLAFEKIGHFFSHYTLIHGLVETGEESLQINTSVKGPTLKDSIQSVRSIIDSGRGEDAIHALKTPHRPLNVVPASTAVAIALVAQKFGFLEMFRLARRSINDDAVLRILSKKDAHRFSVINLKFATQVGNSLLGQSLIQDLSSPQSQKILHEIGQLGAYHRRASLIFADLGNLSQSADHVEEAKRLSHELNDTHFEQTNNIYEEILNFRIAYKGSARALRDATLRLSNIRSEYFKLGPDTSKWWQTNLEKCAVATLFLDAGIHLEASTSEHINSGMRRLYAAHLLNQQFGGSELAETFGEIIQSLKKPENKSLVALAMRNTPEAISRMRRIFAAEDWSRKLRSSISVEMLGSVGEVRETLLLNLIGVSRK